MNNAPTSAMTSRAAPAGAAEQHQYLTFSLEAEAFAIEILNIKEIIEYGNLTTIPMMPAFVHGVINLRGAVVPVIDLNARFGRPSRKADRRTCIVIIEVEHDESKQYLGVLVDSVNEVIDIPSTDIEPPPSFGMKIRADFIRGMGKVNGKFVIILNIGQVLAVEEMGMLEALSERRDEAQQAQE